MVLGVATLWWGALRSWLTGSLRQLAAWLTVAQAGLPLVAIASATSPTAPPEILRAAALHGLAAPAGLLAVWLAVDTIRCRFGTDSIPELGGLLGKAPLASFALLIGGLSLAGVPPLPGFQVQRLLVSGLIHGGSYWPAVALLGADLVIAVAVLDTLRRILLGRSLSSCPTGWSSPWLSASIALAVVALLLACFSPTTLTNWTELALRGALSVSRGGLFLPR
jgi:formate hydrogenlyase subunit 3/multisubunit Na+/H+ antiporter MnhD subunit